MQATKVLFWLACDPDSLSCFLLLEMCVVLCAGKSTAPPPETRIADLKVCQSLILILVVKESKRCSMPTITFAALCFQKPVELCSRLCTCSLNTCQTLCSATAYRKFKLNPYYILPQLSEVPADSPCRQYVIPAGHNFRLHATSGIFPGEIPVGSDETDNWIGEIFIVLHNID